MSFGQTIVRRGVEADETCAFRPAPHPVYGAGSAALRGAAAHGGPGEAFALALDVPAGLNEVTPPTKSGASQPLETDGQGRYMIGSAMTVIA